MAISRYKVQLEQGLSELENVAGAPEILQNNERFNHVMRLCARIEQTIERKAMSPLNSSEELSMLLIFISGNAISLIIYFCVALVTVLLLINPLYFLAQRILKSRVIARYAIACAIGMSAGFAACCASFPEEIPSILTRPLIESERVLYDARWILFGAWLVNPGMGMMLSGLVIAISSLHLLERLGKCEIRSAERLETQGASPRKKTEHILLVEERNEVFSLSAAPGDTSILMENQKEEIHQPELS